LKDPRVVETKNAVDFHLKVKSVKDKLASAEQQKKQYIEERAKFVSVVFCFFSDTAHSPVT
jgi:hypothetical protein